MGIKSFLVTFHEKFRETINIFLGACAGAVLGASYPEGGTSSPGFMDWIISSIIIFVILLILLAINNKNSKKPDD